MKFYTVLFFTTKGSMLILKKEEERKQEIHLQALSEAGGHLGLSLGAWEFLRQVLLHHNLPWPADQRCSG